MAQAKFWRITLRVRRAQAIANGNFERSSFTSTASAETRVRSQPLPIAIETSAARTAGPSFTPSPTAMTISPSSCSARIRSTFSSRIGREGMHLEPEIACDTPSCRTRISTQHFARQTEVAQLLRDTFRLLTKRIIQSEPGDRTGLIRKQYP